MFLESYRNINFEQKIIQKHRYFKKDFVEQTSNRIEAFF